MTIKLFATAYWKSPTFLDARWCLSLQTKATVTISKFKASFCIDDALYTLQASLLWKYVMSDSNEKDRRTHHHYQYYHS